MINIGLKLCLIAIFIIIFWQDTKDRLVYWFLFPTIGVAAYILNARSIGFLPALVNSFLNLMLILAVLLASYLYLAFIKKQGFLNESIGMGDLIFFMFLPFTFSTVTFVILFVFSLIFSLLLHLIYKRKQVDKTVPLAGYMALFFAAVYSISFFTKPQYLFSY